MFTATVLGHPHVKLSATSDTAHAALQDLLGQIASYDPESAARCGEFWTQEEIAGDLAALGKVEAFCGAFAFECCAVETTPAPIPIASCGEFQIYRVAAKVWAIYQAGEFSHNVRPTDAKRYGVAFTTGGADAYATSLEIARQDAMDDNAARIIARRERVAQILASRAARAARSPRFNFT